MSDTRHAINDLLLANASQRVSPIDDWIRKWTLRLRARLRPRCASLQLSQQWLKECEEKMGRRQLD
jgi:hypothetical protein